MKCDWCPPKYRGQFPGCFQRHPGRPHKKNPGSMAELHRLAHRIKPQFFDGLELDYVYRLGVHRHLTANWMLSHTRPSGMRLGGIYTMRQHDDVLQTPTIQADINPTTLSSNFALVYYPFNCLRFETHLQRASSGSGEPLGSQTTVELLRPSATVTANLYDVRRSSGRATLSCLRSVTDHWALGAELLLEWTEPGSVMADTAFATRYAHHNYSIAATASRQGLDLSYWQRIGKGVQLASLLAWHRKTEKSIATVCYQWDFEDAIVRGMFDSDLSVGFLYQRSLPQLPCGFSVSLLMSLPTNRFIFGLKLNLDPSGLCRGEA